MVFEIYQDSIGEWRWRLWSSNYKIIAVSSEGYVNKRDCEYSITLVKSAWNAPVRGA